MKKVIIAIVSILAFILAVFCAVRLTTFWWVVLRDPSRPEFVEATGNFLYGPNVQVEDSTITITWVTQDEYPINSIYFKKKWSRFPNLGGQDVTVQYNVTTQQYHYSTQFQLGLPATHGPGGYTQYIEPGTYTYQVWGNSSDYSQSIASPILDLDLSQ